MEVLVKKVVSKLRIKWSAVRHEGARLRNIANKPPLKVSEVVGVVGPPLALVL